MAVFCFLVARGGQTRVYTNIYWAKLVLADRLGDRREEGTCRALYRALLRSKQEL